MASKSLKILIFTESFLPHTQTFIYDDVVRLSKKHDVQVLCLHRQNNDKFPFQNIVGINYRKNALTSKLWNLCYRLNLSMNYGNRSFRKQLDECIHSFQPDVIHCHFGLYALKLTDNLADRHIPVIVNFHGYDASRLVQGSVVYRRRLQKLLLQKNIFPTATSKSLFDHLSKYRIHSKKSRVIYSGVDPDFFHRQEAEPGKDIFTFLQVAGFRKKKGHQFTVEAFARLLTLNPRRNYRLVFVGGGKLETAIKELCQKLGVADQVAFSGWHSPAGVRQFLQEANAFVHHSVTPADGDMESTTVGILEAMSMELPILASDHSGIPEVVEHGVNGLLTPEKQIDAYAQGMREISDWGLCPQNRQKVIGHFSDAIRTQALENFYYYALDEIGKPLS